MKKLLSLLALIIVCFSLMGMAACDNFWGVEQETVTTVDPVTGETTTETVLKPTEGPAPSDAIGGIIGAWIPGATALLSLLGWGYREMRGRKVDKTAVSLVRGIEDAYKAGKIDKAHVYPILENALKLYGNSEFAKEFIAKAKAEYRKVFGKKE